MTKEFKFTPNNHTYPNQRDPARAKDTEYQKIMDIVEGLWEGKVISRGAGFCLSMSDLIHTVLKQQAGIDSRVVECKLTVLTNDPPSLKLIGHDGLKYGNSTNDLDTHVVCITDTKQPYIIDLSISNVLPYVSYVVEPLNGTEPRMIGEYTYSNSRWIYQERENPKLPKIHQSNILERFNTDRQLFSKMRILKILIAIALTISTANAVRGFYDFYQVYVVDDNYWGPTHMKEIIERLDRLEKHPPR